MVLNEKDILETEAKKPEPSLKLRVCEGCGTHLNVYFCTMHQHNFCRDCLKATKEVGTGTRFKHKCIGLGNCEFLPMGISSVT